MALEKSYNGLEIAIIGMSGQFPESSDCNIFWDNLWHGRELIKTFTDEELINAGVTEDQFKDNRYVRSVGILDNKDCFDHSFFGYSAEEASLMDPQIRLFHENCWKALEDSGYSSSAEEIIIGLFAGAAENNNWKLYALSKNQESFIDPFYLNTISNQSFISTLISYKLNLRGPSIYVSTACSTSLTAVHLACRSLLTRECVIAIAGGISISTKRKKGYLYQEGMVGSSDGHCRAFDKQSTGTAIGEGLGVVVLKRLSEAIKDNDHIYAVIKSTAVNNDGNQKVGYTAPSVKGQSDCIIMAQKLAGVDSNSISYVETHGTGTKLGDPIEIRALNRAFGVGSEHKFCGIGSVKTNIGHLNIAAGIAGLIKVSLSLKNNFIPASLHFKEANPEIDFNGGPFYVNNELKRWNPKGDLPRRAGVSSFGIGGTNAHAILEEAPKQKKSDIGRTYKLLTISAKTQQSLSRYIDDLKKFLVSEPSVNLADMSYTLQVGRKHFEYRKSVVFRDRTELFNLLDREKEHAKLIRTSDRDNSIVFMFSGAGSQYVNMGKDLYESEAIFKDEMDKGFSMLEKLTGENYKNILYPESDDDLRINDMQHTQPVIFLFGYALAKLIQYWGLKPNYMIGHSIGEYIAACLSGVFTYEDVLRLVVKRGQLMNRMPSGAMLSLSISNKETDKFLSDKISLAAINSPEQVVFSGDTLSVEQLIAKIEDENISFIKLYTSHAGHSYMIDDILDDYRKELETININSPQIPFISNLTGDFISEWECTSIDYWLRHMRETVQFSKGVSTLLCKSGNKIFIEIGGGHSLTSLLRQNHSDELNATAINLIKHPKELKNDKLVLAEQLGKLWTLGAHIDWLCYNTFETRKRVSLPTYSFESNRFPTEVSPFENKSNFLESTIKEKSKLNIITDWIYLPSWRSTPITEHLNGNVRCYLFFSFSNDFSNSLKPRLLKKGDELIEVLIGDNYIQHSKNKYIIDPQETLHIEKLFNDLQSELIFITDIIYSWAIGINAPKFELNGKNREINLLYFGFANIIKQLAKQNVLKKKRFFTITDSLHDVIGTEKINYSQSLLLGLTNVLPQEYSVTCSNIDINLAEKNKDIYEHLANEIKDEANGDKIKALRCGKRWIKDFQKNPLKFSEEEDSLKHGQVYLITGGLGNVGFTIAKQIVEKYKCKVALIGRNKAVKSSWNTNSLDRLQQLKSLSKGIKYYCADVADEKALKIIVKQVEKELGTIKGVIHTAGYTKILDFELIEDITAEKTLAMFAPKVQGIENLYNIFKDYDLDFLWATSSLASILGGVSFSSYSSANLFMEHFITSKKLAKWKCIALSEMYFNEEFIKRERDSCRKALKPDEIFQLFKWSISIKDCPVILETVEDLSSRINKVYNVRRELYIDDFNPGDIQKIERPDLENEYIIPTTKTEKVLTMMIEDLFGIKNIGIEDNFFELGGDSLKAMVLLRRIRKEFNISMPLKEFFISQNIRQIAVGIDEKLWINTKSDRKIISII